MRMTARLQTAPVTLFSLPTAPDCNCFGAVWNYVQVRRAFRTRAFEASGKGKSGRRARGRSRGVREDTIAAAPALARRVRRAAGEAAGGAVAAAARRRVWGHHRANPRLAGRGLREGSGAGWRRLGVDDSHGFCWGGWHDHVGGYRGRGAWARPRGEGSAAPAEATAERGRRRRFSSDCCWERSPGVVGAGRCRLRLQQSGWR